MKTLLIIALVTGALVTVGVFGAMGAIERISQKKHRIEDGTGYRVTITTLKPYHVEPYEVFSILQVDTLVNYHLGALQLDVKWSHLLRRNKHFRIEIDNLEIYVEQKELRINRNGDAVLKRRKMKVSQ